MTSSCRGPCRPLVALAALLLSLMGCAARPGLDSLAPAAAPDGAEAISAYVATTRQREAPGANGFTNRRSRELNFAQYRFAIPRQPAASGAAPPAIPLGNQVLGAEAFDAELNARRCGAPGASTLVFVHGYNTNFPEALLRLVRMVADADRRAVPILFAWPSDASALGYVADRDSAAYSRDYLADFLIFLAGRCGGGQISVIGHSMGGWLTVEALRQLRLAGRDDVIARLQVALASPDIDVEVFRTQMRVVGPLTPPMVVLVSRDDRALSFSSQLAGARPRLGRLDVNDPEVQETAREAHLAVVDISGLSTTDTFNHDRFVSFAGAYARLEAQGAITAGGGLRRAGAFVFNAVGTAVSSPFTLAGRVLSPD